MDNTVTLQQEDHGFDCAPFCVAFVCTVVFKIIAARLKTFVKLKILIMAFILMHGQLCTLHPKSKCEDEERF